MSYHIIDSRKKYSTDIERFMGSEQYSLALGDDILVILILRSLQRERENNYSFNKNSLPLIQEQFQYLIPNKQGKTMHLFLLSSDLSCQTDISVN